MDDREEAVNQMLRLLGGFSKKLNVAICLPLLLDQPQFKNSFKHQYAKEYEELHKLCIDANFMADKQDEADECFSKNESSMQIVVYDENSKNQLRWTSILGSLSKCEDEILTLLNDTEIFSDYKIIVRHIKLLQEIVKYRMSLTPNKLHERKIELRNAEVTISEVSADIEILESSYTDETCKYKSTIENSRKEVNDLNVIISETKRNSREAFEHKINSCRARLREFASDVKEDEANVENQLKAHENLLEELVKADLEREKLLRQKCIKMEKKCLERLNAYDRDLSKLHDLKDSLEEQLNLTSRHYDVLQSEYNVQTSLYTELKKERELAMMQEFAERLDNFEKNRAARVIQRTWRAYHERMASKKKKKTRKNK